jgi:flagellar protein FliT
MDIQLLHFYEAIERASADMLQAARSGDWEQVVRIEGACVLLIGELQRSARSGHLSRDDAQRKARIMHRILLNDAEVRQLAEPWLDRLDELMAGRPRLLH